jgi:uncharacterized Zn finger protein
MGHERCPRCADSLRIVRVKFKWSGTSLLYACPNCAQVQDSVLKADAPPEGQSTTAQWVQGVRQLRHGP